MALGEHRRGGAGFRLATFCALTLVGRVVPAAVFESATTTGIRELNEQIALTAQGAQRTALQRAREGFAVSPQAYAAGGARRLQTAQSTAAVFQPIRVQFSTERLLNDGNW